MTTAAWPWLPGRSRRHAGSTAPVRGNPRHPFNMIEENLAVPFETTVLGVTVIVEGVGQTPAGLVANCARGKYRQAIHLLDLPLPTPPPPGADWIAAYRQYCR
jgi:hypothetical protein